MLAFPHTFINLIFCQMLSVFDFFNVEEIRGIPAQESLSRDLITEASLIHLLGDEGSE